jgi:DNA polymerase-3 subunit alpha
MRRQTGSPQQRHGAPSDTDLSAPVDSKTLIWAWLREGWRYRQQSNHALVEKKHAYSERVKYEMSLIELKDFIDYFLMLSDIVRYAKDNGIAVGPARGSAAASLVCYLLRITEIDPMPFPSMLFERFIDINRNDIPDVDLDFDDERRDELRQYAERKYGADHVGNIGTFTKYKGKNSLDDVARVHNIPPYVLNDVKSVIVERSSGDSRASESILDTVNMFPQAKAVFERYPALYKALRLEGNYKSWSTHAAGLVISNDPITDNCAWYERTTGSGKSKKTRNVLSVDKHDAEHLGLMKADFLGLTTMGAISNALKMLGISLQEMYTIPLDDPKIISAFKRNDVTGIFQFGGGATRVVNGDVKPDNFLELCDINALSRPGPLHSGSTGEYIAVKHGHKKPEHIHPIVDRLTVHTKFQIIYQEQILQLVREVGGFDWTHAAEIRKIISQKYGEQAFNRSEGAFLEGAKRLHNMDKATAQKIWRRLATAGTYAFNAAHCVSYSMLAYWTMWLKVYHPQAFYASHLAKFPDDDAQFKLLRDALKHGIKVLPPDLNKSFETWHRDGDSVRAGFSQIPNIGDSYASAIVADREANGPFGDWEDLIRVKGIGPAKMDGIRSMAMSDDPFRIYGVDHILQSVRDALLPSGDLGGRFNHRLIRKASEIPTDAKKDLELVWVGIPTARNPQDIVEDERARTGEDFDTIRKRLKRPDLVKKMAVVAIDDSDETVYLRFSRFDFPRFQEALWDMKLNHDVVVVYGKRLSMVMGRNVQVKKMMIVDGDDL